jgi:hypothetical protein
LYEKVKEQVISTIHSHVLTLAFTFDLWTSITKEIYMGVTVHFVSAVGTLYSLCVCITQLHGSYTGEAIAQVMTDVINQLKKPFTSQTIGMLIPSLSLHTLTPHSPTSHSHLSLSLLTNTLLLFSLLSFLSSSSPSPPPSSPHLTLEKLLHK